MGNRCSNELKGASIRGNAIYISVKFSVVFKKSSPSFFHIFNQRNVKELCVFVTGRWQQSSYVACCMSI